MTLFSTALSSARDWRKTGHMLPIVLSAVMAAGAVALVAYLLWPTWESQSSGDPGRLPVSIGGTLFNVPTQAVRMKIQRHSGPAERVDLAFNYPSLTPPISPKHVTADTVAEAMQPVDQIFLSIAAHHGTFSPETLLRTIYPRYLDPTPVELESGLTMRAFRDSTAYAGEDLFSASDPPLNARCSRDGLTPGMCLSELRIDGADLTYRFPRSWLRQWREIADSMERLTLELHGAK